MTDKTEWLLSEPEMDARVKEQEDVHASIIETIGYNPAESSKTMLKYLVDTIKKNAVGEDYYVLIQAEGGGDSGEVYNVEIKGRLPERIEYYECTRKKVKLEREYWIREQHPELSKHYMSREWGVHVMTELQTEETEEALVNIAYHIAELSGYDWYNNEGGEWSVEIEPDSIEYKMQCNVVSLETLETYGMEDLKQ